MDIAATFVADEQSLEVVQPGEGALDDPAVSAQSGAVLGLAAGDDRFDAVLADESAVLVVGRSRGRRSHCRGGGAAGRAVRSPPALPPEAGSAG